MEDEALAGQVDALVQSVLGDADLVDPGACLQFLENIGGERPGIQRLLEAYGQPEQISLRKLLAFILDAKTVLETTSQQDGERLLPLPPGLYQNTSRGIRRVYVVVTAKGNSYVFNNQMYRLEISTGLEQLRLSDFKVREEPFTTDSRSLQEKEIAKLLPAEELEKARKPRPFSPCLVGHYGGYQGGAPSSGGTYVEYFSETLTIEKDGSVRYCDAYDVLYMDMSDMFDTEGQSTKGPEQSSRVKSVSRGGEWSAVIHPGPDAHVEARIPPLCLIELEDGRKFDLGKFHFTMQSALLSSTKISYPGHIKQEEGAECIVSFPGRYPDGWLECVQGSHDMSVACVFLCGKEDGLGEHAVDPEDGAKCYCHKIYGLSPPREYAEYGYNDPKSCEENGGRPLWGCHWFKRWRENVELAVQWKQKLIVYFFAGEVGQGLVKWEELPTAKLWDGKGLGGSQKGEVAYLKKMGYDFEMRDVGPFLKDFAATTIRID